MAFLILFAIPALIAAGMLIFGGRRVTLKEFLLQLAIQALIAGCSIGIIYYANTYDVEVWNGRISSKERERVPCSHSYPCHCHEVCSGSGSNRSCYTHCDTCYVHSYDVDWNLYTTTNEVITIDRVDSQGLAQPQRWTDTLIGEPMSTTHSYTNYIKAAPDTLFRRSGDYSKMPLPGYPQAIYDYYRLNRLVLFGVKMTDAALWNHDLSEVNAVVGKTKQANVILVLTKNQPQDWFYALEKHWLGGKKNDVIVVGSLDEGGSFQWVKVMAWTTNEMVKVAISDDLMELGTPDRSRAIPIIQQNVISFYKRKPMRDFEYLKASITPTPTGWVVSLIFGLIAAIGLSVLVWKLDIFEEENG